jgi:uncharacterized protein (TIGR02145 family)
MKSIYILILFSSFYISSYAQNPCPGSPTIDYTGKIYHTVQIGSQCWLKENLDVGTQISRSLEQTNNSTIEKYCYHDIEDSCTKYGGLYQWNEAMQYVTGEKSKGICPTGWHIPTHAEFVTLSTAVGGDGNSLKAIGQGSTNQGHSGVGSDTSSFSALLAGAYDKSKGGFLRLEMDAYFWSSTDTNSTSVYLMYMYCYDSIITFYVGKFKEDGFSVRCIKD